MFFSILTMPMFVSRLDMEQSMYVEMIAPSFPWTALPLRLQYVHGALLVLIY